MHENGSSVARNLLGKDYNKVCAGITCMIECRSKGKSREEPPEIRVDLKEDIVKIIECNDGYCLDAINEVNDRSVRLNGNTKLLYDCIIRGIHDD